MPQTQADRGLVLHVEDDPAVAASLALLLRLAGFRALSASDGESALRLVTNEGVRPDALIVDFSLPGEMDGSETAEAVSRALHESIPTIMLSGELANASLPWLPGVPIWPMAKPAQPDLMVKAVETFVALHRWITAQAAAGGLPRCA